MQSPPVRRRRLGEITYPNTPEFRAALKEWCLPRGRKTELAKRFRATQGTITRLIRGDITESKLIGPICRYIGAPLPSGLDEPTNAMLVHMRTHHPEQFKAAMDWLKTIYEADSTKKPSK